jgi:dsDNA-specific endonuclease/ATPase MutS2
VKENGVLMLLSAVNDIVTHETLAKRIAACIDDNGNVRDSASPELERARQRVASLEGTYTVAPCHVSMSFHVV